MPPRSSLFQSLQYVLSRFTRSRGRMTPRPRRVHLEQLESRRMLFSDPPTAVDDGLLASPIAITVNSSSNQINVVLNDLDDQTTPTALVAAEVTLPSHGTLTPSPLGFVYVPAANYTGPDSFTYRVTDQDNLQSNIATVYLFVNPFASAGTLYLINEGASLLLQSTGSQGHGALSYSWVIDPLPASIDFDDPRAIHTANPTLTWQDLDIWGIDDGNIENAVVALRVVDENLLSATSFASLSVADVAPAITSFTIVAAGGCGTDVVMNATITEVNPNDQLTVFINWDGLTSPDEVHLGAPAPVSPGGSTYTISVPSYPYATAGYKYPLLRVTAAGGNGGLDQAININVTNGVEDPDSFDPDFPFPFFINVTDGVGTPPAVALDTPSAIGEGMPLTLSAHVTGSAAGLSWSLSSSASAASISLSAQGDPQNPTFNVTWANLVSLGIVDSSAAPFTLTLDASGTSACSDPAPASAELVVYNLSPVVAPIVGPNQGVPFQTLSYSGSFTDVTADTHTKNWQVLNSANAVIATGNGTSFNYTPTISDTYTVKFTVTDDEMAATTVSQSVVVTPSLQIGTGLLLGGSSSADNISLNPNDILADTTTITIFGGGGNDDIQIAGSITANVWIYGGDGNDRLKGGGGHDVLVGGDGDDLLMGRDGRDILIGGTGADRIIGNADEDILISGAVDFANLADALAAIQAEWLSGCTYAERTANIDGTGSGPRLNGSYFLIKDAPNANVHDDGVKDTLTGDEGNDWFFANLALDGGDSAQKDKITDLTAAEFAADIDWINAP